MKCDTHFAMLRYLLAVLIVLSVSAIYPNNAAFTIQIPTLVSPANNAVDIPIEQTLSWSAVPGAASYTLQLAYDQAFTNIVLVRPNLTTTSYSLIELWNNKTYYWRVSAEQSGSSSGFSSPFKFNTVKLTNIVLSWPTGGASLYIACPQLSWYVPEGGTGWKYDLIYSTNAGLSSPAVISNLTSNIYVLTGLQPGVKYYWRIKLRNSAGNVISYSNIESFISYGRSLVPVASWPLGNTVINNLSPTLYWYLNDLSIGLTYELELRQGPPSALTGTPTVLNITSQFLTISSLLPDKQYSWSVRSKSLFGYSDWSTPVSFMTPGLVQTVVPVASWPVGYPTIYTASPTLYWYTGASCACLTFQVEYVEGLNTAFTGVPNITNITGLSTALSGLIPGKSYKWRVRSVYGSAFSAWSEPASFRINDYIVTSPVIPAPSWPVGGALVYCSYAGLYWYILGAVPYGMTFEIEFGTGQLTGMPTLTGITSLYTFLTGLHPDMTYKWRIRSKLGSSYSAWSEIQTFKTISGIGFAAKPVLSWPIGRNTVYTQTPALFWFMNSYSFGLKYELQYSTSPCMCDPVTISGLTLTQYTTPALKLGQTYYWRVRSFDGSVYSCYSDIASFVIYGGFCPVAPIAASPVDGTEILDRSPLLSWFIPTEGDVESYQIEYSSSPDMYMPSVKTAQSNSLSVELNNNGEYYWRVRSKSSKGELSEYSDIHKFVMTSATGIKRSSDVITSYDLKQNYPNPFNPVTTITYNIPKQSYVELNVYDMLGRFIRSLVNMEQSQGQYKVEFSGSDLPSGMYIYQIKAGEYVSAQKMILLK